MYLFGIEFQILHFLCFSISRHFSFRFFSVSVFLCIFSSHDHDFSISHLHSYAFHTLSIISYKKSTKYWCKKKKTQSRENFKFHIQILLFYTVSACLKLKKLG